MYTNDTYRIRTYSLYNEYISFDQLLSYIRLLIDVTCIFRHAWYALDMASSTLFSESHFFIFINSFENLLVGHSFILRYFKHSAVDQHFENLQVINCV